jgi:hypothetical protein
MSVTSVLTDRPTSYRPISGHNAPIARVAAAAKPSPASKTTAPVADPGDASELQSALAQALRTDGAAAPGSTAAAPGSTNEASESGDGQRSAGIALYKRVSQIGNGEPSASELLKSWNSIMQSGQDADDRGAGVLQALLRSGASPFGSDILDVTA